MINNEQSMIQYFKFEEDFVEDNIRCIPMIARFKLDACGIKLKLNEWSRMNEEERTCVSEYPCSSEEEIRSYRQYIKTLVRIRTSNEAQDMEVDTNPGWANPDLIPEILAQKLAEQNNIITLKQWQDLNDLQRFVLVKLSRPGHENRNFPIAMREFGLI
jgi:hypothetical protein